jgi:hypothetical protein
MQQRQPLNILRDMFPYTMLLFESRLATNSCYLFSVRIRCGIAQHALGGLLSVVDSMQFACCLNLLYEPCLALLLCA